VVLQANAPADSVMWVTQFHIVGSVGYIFDILIFLLAKLSHCISIQPHVCCSRSGPSISFEWNSSSLLLQVHQPRYVICEIY